MATSGPGAFRQHWAGTARGSLGCSALGRDLWPPLSLQHHSRAQGESLCGHRPGRGPGARGGHGGQALAIQDPAGSPALPGQHCKAPVHAPLPGADLVVMGINRDGAHTAPSTPAPAAQRLGSESCQFGLDLTTYLLLGLLLLCEHLLYTTSQTRAREGHG